MDFPGSDLLKPAQEGDTISQLNLGKLYFQSTFIENNCLEAFKWISRSAEEGNNKEAQFILADFYAVGQGAQQSFTNAYHWYTKSAIQGYEMALSRLRKLYHNDVMLRCPSPINNEEKKMFRTKPKETINYRQSRMSKWKPCLSNVIDYFSEKFETCQYTDLFDDENNENQTLLAFLYHHGYGVKKDIEEAKNLYTKAAERGYSDAQYNLAYLYQNELSKDPIYDEAFQWYSAAANGGNIEAQKILAYLYENGLGTEMDYKLAVYWYKEAANSGDTYTQLHLENLQKSNYRMDCDDMNIDKCPINIEYFMRSSTKERLRSKLKMDLVNLNQLENIDSLKELTESALVGDRDAIYEIGIKYYKGDYFPRERYIGYKWVRLAAKLGLGNAQCFIGKIYENGDVVEQNYYKASIWYKKAVDQYHRKAQFQLGILYSKGLGVSQNILKAKKLFENLNENSSRFQFGLLYYSNKDYQNAIRIFEECARNGILDTYRYLKDMYWYGLGVAKDKNRALQLLEYTANRGDTESQIIIAEVYRSGAFFERNIEKSTLYLFMAAESGNPLAKYRIALKYLSGEIFRQDYTTAYHLIKEAADKGVSAAMKIIKVDFTIPYLREDFGNTLEMLIYACENISAKLEYNVGYIYENRISIRQYWGQRALNATHAVTWYTIAANRSESRALFRLGLMFEEGKGVEKDLGLAKNYYSMAAKQNHGDAIFRLACMYIDGRDTPQDFIKAFELYNAAADLGNKEANDILALKCYSRKSKYYSYRSLPVISVKINDDNNIKMLEAVAENGNLAVQHQLGTIFEPYEQSRGFKWYNIAIQGGITNAYYRLAIMYEEGRGVEQDYKKAIDLYHQIIERNHSEALYRLGHMYQYGKGVERDYFKAYNLYERAVELSNDLAWKSLNISRQINLSSKAISFDNLFRSRVEEYKDSIVMYKHVAEQGNVHAQYILGRAYQTNFTEGNYQEAIKWYTLAAENGHANAIYHLGLLHENGVGFDKGYYEAIKLYEQARNLGNLDSTYRLGLAYEYGNGVQVSVTKAIRFYSEAAKSGHYESKNKLNHLYTMGQLSHENTSKAFKIIEKLDQQKKYNIFEDYFF